MAALEEKMYKELVLVCRKSGRKYLKVGLSGEMLDSRQVGKLQWLALDRPETDL